MTPAWLQRAREAFRRYPLLGLLGSQAGRLAGGQVLEARDVAHVPELRDSLLFVAELAGGPLARPRARPGRGGALPPGWLQTPPTASPHTPRARARGSSPQVLRRSALVEETVFLRGPDVCGTGDDCDDPGVRRDPRAPSRARRRARAAPPSRRRG